MDSAIIIFIKNPVAGKVKTRIGRVVGDDKALEIYLELCRLTRSAVEEIPLVKYLFYSDEILVKDEWSSQTFHKELQKGNDLGERMFNAFKMAFERYKHVVIIGSDCPYLKEMDLIHAIDLLEYTDCVIGPAIDGGYYLLGLNFMIPELFRNILWSSPMVYRETVNQLELGNYTFRTLGTLGDIDKIEDWERYKSAMNY